MLLRPAKVALSYAVTAQATARVRVLDESVASSGYADPAFWTAATGGAELMREARVVEGVRAFLDLTLPRMLQRRMKGH